MVRGPVKLAKATDPTTGKSFMVDMGTRNQSFLQTHQELKFLGIKNNAFMLKLCDPNLAGVDPYDPTLDKNTKDRVQLECSRNFWYYVREVARVPIQNSKPVPIYLHRPSCAQFWLFTKHIDSTLNIPRRCYKTSNTLAGPYAWAYNFGLNGGRMVMFNYENSQVWVNLDTFKGMLDALPPYMKYSAVIVEDDPALAAVGKKKKKPTVKKKIDNVKSIRHPVTGNVVSTRGRAQNPEGAAKFGRGDAINMPYFDEAEWINYLPDILAASGPSYQEALNMARKSGAAACRLFTTTPGYLNNPNQRVNYEKFISIQPKWDEKLYDMSDDDIDEYMKTNGNGFTKILYIEYNYLQCRRDDGWLQSMVGVMNGDMLKFRTEVLLQRLSANENGPFDPYDVDYIIQNKKEPVATMMVAGTCRLDIYDHMEVDVGQPLDPMLPYIIGIDPATGVGGDSTAVVGINPHNLKPAFEYGSNFVSESKVITFIVSLVRMLPYCIVVIERKSAGPTLIRLIREQYPDVAARLYKSEYDPKKIYIREKIDPNINQKEVREAIEQKLYGVATDSQTRDQIQSLWVEYVHSYKSVVYTQRVVQDISTMAKTNTGQIKASAGAHDDFIFAWGLALWGYHHGQHLERWGFVKPKDHPLEKDAMPTREKKQLNPHAANNINAMIIQQANNKLSVENEIFNHFLPKVATDGHRRSFQVTPIGCVTQGMVTERTDEWLDHLEGGNNGNAMAMRSIADDIGSVFW